MDTTPSINLSRVLLIDLDNCPTQIAHLPHTLEIFSRIIVCYGGFEPKIPLSQLALLAPAIVSGNLTIEAMERKGKNAADFGLTFWAGRLVMEMPPETEFLILSQDNDLDYLIDMLRHSGRKVKRVDGNSVLNLETAMVNQDNPAEDEMLMLSLEAAAQNYYAVQISSRRARPARRLTLLNSIRSHFKNEKRIDPDAVLQELIRQGVLSMGRAGKIIYRDRLASAAISEDENLKQDSNTSNGEKLTSVNLTETEISNVMPPERIRNLTDEYYLIHIANHRTRPVRRIALLNSISSHFKGQPAVDPNALMAELFQRGLVSQDQRGMLHYHKQPSLAISESPVEEANPVEIINPPALESIKEELPEPVTVIKNLSAPVQEKLAEIPQEILLREDSEALPLIPADPPPVVPKKPARTRRAPAKKVKAETEKVKKSQVEKTEKTQSLSEKSADLPIAAPVKRKPIKRSPPKRKSTRVRTGKTEASSQETEVNNSGTNEK